MIILQVVRWSGWGTKITGTSGWRLELLQGHARTGVISQANDAASLRPWSSSQTRIVGCALQPLDAAWPWYALKKKNISLAGQTGPKKKSKLCPAHAADLEAAPLEAQGGLSAVLRVTVLPHGADEKLACPCTSQQTHYLCLQLAITGSQGPPAYWSILGMYDGRVYVTCNDGVGTPQKRAAVRWLTTNLLGGSNQYFLHRIQHQNMMNIWLNLALKYVIICVNHAVIWCARYSGSDFG